MKKLILAAATLAAVLPAPAFADPPPWAPAHGRRAHDAAMYDRNGRYTVPRKLTSQDTVWRGSNGTYYCRRSNGTTGLIVGGAVGALIGRSLDGGRHRTVGTLIGAGTGALLGREIERGSLSCH
jgi:hypothetical protein